MYCWHIPVLTCSGSVASQIMSKYGWKEGQGKNIPCALTRLNWWTNLFYSRLPCMQGRMMDYPYLV